MPAASDVERGLLTSTFRQVACPSVHPIGERRRTAEGEPARGTPGEARRMADTSAGLKSPLFQVNDDRSLV
jgi:hypothetical protein